MSNRQTFTPETAPGVTILDLLGRVLSWVEGHQAPRTYDWYRDYLKSFGEHIGPKLRLAHLKPFHVTEWLDNRFAKCGDDYKNGADRGLERSGLFSLVRASQNATRENLQNLFPRESTDAH